LFILKSYVTSKITKRERAQNIIMDSIKRLKYRIASSSIGYDAILEMTIYETVIDYS